MALALAALVTGLLAIAAPAAAQCPVPAPAPPTIDGSLDPVYQQRGTITDYVANNVSASARLYQIDDTCVDPSFIYLAWEIELGFVDNSYGANRNMGAKFPWDKGHSFFDLTESDGQRLQILNVCGEDVVDIFMDYIDGPNVPGPEYGTPSGYEVVQPASCAGATCAETTKFLINGGDWTRFIYDTSLGYDLNDLGFCTNDGPGGAPPDCDDAGTDLLVDSPPWSNEDDFIPASPYDPWLYNHIYEIRIDRSVFSTASCPQGTPALIRTDPVELHASPSKIGESPVDLFRSYSAIGDYVWLDADRDGVQDAGESGIPNVTLALYADDGDGVFEPDTAVIDGELDVNGDGLVDALDDGAVAGATVIDGLLDLDGDGTAGETNGDDSGTLNTVTVIDGRLDIDGDADVDPADDGIFAGDDGTPLATTVTDSRGRYAFTRLGAGDYFVDVTDDNGILAGFALSVGPQSETDPSALIELPRQEEYPDADFGYAPADLTKAVVGNYVWSDADNDGIQDPGEAGIGGVTLDLFDADTTLVVATTVTAPDGTYLFTGVDPGSYYVDVTDTLGVLAGYTLTSGPQSESDPSTGFQLLAGDVYLNADFGYFNPALGALGNQVWFDVDEDAVFDAGEPGLGNVTLAVIDDADGDGVWDPGERIVASRPTALDGTYTFSGLPLDDGGGDGDADYLVWVSDTRNVLGGLLESVFLPLGSTADNQSKVAPYAVDLNAGLPVDNTADFGFLIDNEGGMIGDRVWYDDDGDGAQDPTEPGIEDVRVLLYNDKNKNGQIDAGRDFVIATRTTDINGNYYFTRLAADANGEGYILVVSEFNPHDILDGVLDLDGDGIAGETNGDDDGTVDGVTVDDGLLDLDADGTAGETNGDDSGSLSGFKIIDGAVDLDFDGAIETNGDDSRFAPLENFTQTGDPDEAGTCSVCDEQASSILTTADRIDLTIDFGYDGVGTFTVGDTVYHDLNGNGVQEAGEPGLELVTLAIYQDLDGDGVVDPDEPVIATKVTDSNGNYLFNDLILVDYVVVITDENGILTGYTQTQGSPADPVPSGTLSTLEKDFGFVRDRPGTISNFVWEDLDGDGLQDAGEPGVPNVTVNLYDPGADGMPGGGDDTLVATTTTGAAGTYSFTVPPGDYFVEFEAPPAYLLTLADIGGDDLVDSDPSPLTGFSAVTTLLVAENDPSWDAGLYRPVAVGDRVWLDVDGDGVEDVGEPGIGNVFLELWDAGGDGAPGGGDDTLAGTLVTDPDGYYLFPLEPPATYFVDVVDGTVPAGLTLSGGADPSTASTLLSGQRVVTKDFGYTDDGGAVIGDFVWSDADGDGIQDPGEAGIGGVTVDLIYAGPDGVFGTADDTTTTTSTAPDGSYLFTGLAAGDYRVDVTDTGGVLAGYALTSGPHSSSDPTAPITVKAGELVLDADFGYFQAGLGTVGSHVWADADDDGVRDAGEAGIGGVSLALVADTVADGVWDPDGADDVPGSPDDEPVIATVTTAADGSYSFTGLALDDGDGDADYLVTVTDVARVLAGLARTAGPTPGADDNSQADPYAVALSGGSPSDLTADFGFSRPGTVGDRVWSDADGDGTQDGGEAGIGGVTLDLLGPGPDALIGTADDVVLATETTAGDGSYLFALLLPDDYRVVVTDSGGVLAGYTQTGDPDEAGACAVCDGESTLTLAADSSDLTRDFGYRNAALLSISGTVFHDVDRDARHDDPPETGFGGVTMELWHDVDGNGVLDPAIDERLAVTVTDGAGDYLFPGLPDDDYVVAVTDRDGVLTGYQLTSGLDQIPVEVAGADVTDVDFGYVRDPLVGAIGDSVWLDVDPPGAAGPDGLQGPNEPGIPGVAVSLYQDADGDGALEPDAAVIDGRVDLDGDGDVDAFDDGELGTVGIIDGRLDLDGDGVIESNGDDDGAWSGVTVDDGLLDLDGDGGAGETNGDDTGALAGDDGGALAATVTDANGKYLFTGLGAGDYFVDVDETTLPDSTADGSPDLRETGYPVGREPASVIRLSEGELHLDADFGYLPRAGTAIIGDFVWYDADSDGLQDDGEAGIGGVDVTYLGAGPDGDLGTADDTTATTTTASNGFYIFTGLAPGSYVAAFDPLTLPPGYNTTPTNTGPDSTYNVTLLAGDAVTFLDWGFDGGVVGSIGDRVWLDLDGDGAQDAGEPGIAGVSVDLVGPGPNLMFGDADDEILSSMSTGADGIYDFSGLAADSYRVDVTDLGVVLDGLSLSGGSDPTATITLLVGEDYDLADFGYTAATGVGSIGSHVWHDLDFDGFRDPGELPVQGVTLELWLDADGDGVIQPGIDNLVRGAATDVNGEYEFKALPFGNYLVDLTDDSAVLGGFTRTSGTPGLDDHSQADPYALTLSSASPRDVTADFGFRDDTASTALDVSGTVFEDSDVDGLLDFVDGDGDGIYDPGETTLEPLVQGARMLLYRVVGSSRFFIGSTTTDLNGFYQFSDLAPGTYEVEVATTATSVDGFLQTTQTSSGGVEPAPLPDGGDPEDPPTDNSANNNFGFYDAGVTTTPVTLSYFQAIGGSGRVEIEWVTATEVGNVGFHLWAGGPEGWRRLNDGLIPAHGGDSLVPRSYRFEAPGGNGDRFLLEDVDVLGVSRYHGPFQLGRAHGRKDVEADAIDWRGIRARHQLQRAARGRAARSGAIWRGAAAARLVVEADGIYRVTHEQLAGAGIDLTGVPAAHLALSNRGRPVPMRVEPRGRFGRGSYVEFVGVALDTLYTRANVYVLRADPGAAERPRIDPSRPGPFGSPPKVYRETLRVENDRRYSFLAPNGDPWYDTRILALGGPASASLPFETEGRVAGAGPVVLTLSVWGGSDFARAPDHHLLVRVNGVELADERFDGIAELTVSFEIPESVLEPGENTLELVLPGDQGTRFDLVHLDRFEVAYPRSFEARAGALAFESAAELLEVYGLPDPQVTVYRLLEEGVEQVAGVEVTGVPGAYRARFTGVSQTASYRVASEAGLLTPGIELLAPAADLKSGPAELLVISHPDFLDGLEPWTGARRAAGWTIKVVDVEEIYRQFGFGIFDPQAIRAYVGFAHTHLETEAVLLVGGDTYDYHDNLGQGSVSFVPSLYGRTGEIVRFAPGDGLFTDLDGDEVPDLAIGRLPVRTREELASVLEKTLAFEAAPRRSVLLAADDYDEPSRFDFTQASEQLAARVPGPWTRERVYLDELDVATAREELLARMNEGPAVTSFMGHSGPLSWSFDGLFTSTDAAGLENAGLPTVIAQWGCWTTYYVSPSYNTLAHKLLLSGDRGAAAVLGATTLTEARSERALGLEIFRRAFEPGVSLGQAVLEAKRRLAALGTPAVLDVLIGWNLLGDPTLGLAGPTAPADE